MKIPDIKCFGFFKQGCDPVVRCCKRSARIFRLMYWGQQCKPLNFIASRSKSTSAFSGDEQFWFERKSPLLSKKSTVVGAEYVPLINFSQIEPIALWHRSIHVTTFNPWCWCNSITILLHPHFRGSASYRRQCQGKWVHKNVSVFTRKPGHISVNCCILNQSSFMS